MAFRCKSEHQYGETWPSIRRRHARHRCHAMIWRIFMSATMQAAVHLGQDDQENLRTTKTPTSKRSNSCSTFHRKFILNQSDEIFGISTIGIHFHGRELLLLRKERRPNLCHLKNSELEPKFQKYKGRVVLRSDILKD